MHQAGTPGGNGPAAPAPAAGRRASGGPGALGGAGGPGRLGVPTADPGTGAAGGPAARHRLNLIELISADAVASDYAGQPPDPRASSRRQRVLVGAIALGVIGFVLALGFSARVLNAPAVDGQRAALIARIDQARTEQAGLDTEVGDLRAEVEQARASELERALGGAAVAREVAALEVMAGYTAVTGPGAVVTLTDAATEEQASEEDADLTKVLDSDVQRAVNGLWAAGAEAIAVNGQRLSTRSAIRSAAGAILVNYRPLSPPYRVEAIGPPGLAAVFERGADAAELRDVSQQFGIGFATEQAESLRLPASTSPLPEYATVIGPVEGGAP
ncbi:MAG TPA: DUF881 domain-containing protein [Candidatus Nanopelagicales bacterium]